MHKSIYISSAVASGGLLAMMTFFNGELARYTSPTWSSLIAHFVGIVGSWILWKFISHRKTVFPYSSHAPKWSYFGGAGGAIIVVIANMTVNSRIGLVGSVSLMILGQTLFAMVFDVKGWVGMAKRTLDLSDVLQVTCIVAGSMFIIFY